jgi:rhamnosyltransferase
MKATVVIPVYNGIKDHLEETMAAVFSQVAHWDFEVLVIDSGSTDGSVNLLQRFAETHHKLRLVQIPNSEFSHGGTRQWAAQNSNGEYVVYLSQDAVPANDNWLVNMISAFASSKNVGGVIGRQIPRPNSFPLQKAEINQVFDVQGSSSDYTTYDRHSRGQGVARFYSDVCSAAPRRILTGPVPYRDVPYAEDQAFGNDLVDAGYEKVYARNAAVIHSNDISLREYPSRIYDEFAGLRRVGIFPEVPNWKYLVLGIWREAIPDAIRALSDKEYSPFQKFRFAITAPLYRYARWLGQNRATKANNRFSLESRRKGGTS